MKQFINRVFGLIERKLTSRWFNPFATLYVNFRTMPFKQACHLPIYVYGKAKFYNLKGKVHFTCKVKRGLVKMGRHDDCYTNAPFGKLLLEKGAKIVFDGYCSISTGYIIKLGKDAVLQIGKFVRLGNSCTIVCSKLIRIGDYSSITFNCLLMDTNSHYTININTYKVCRREGSICIGEKNWVGNNSRILKGTHTGSNCLVGAGSMVNKDFSTRENALLAGVPAMVKFEGINRCFSFAREKEISEFFNAHPNKNYIHFNESYTDPIDDLIKFFK